MFVKRVAAAASLWLCVAPAAISADLMVKAPARPSVTTVAAWTGWYAGLAVGGRGVDATWRTLSVADAFGDFLDPIPETNNAAFRTAALAVAGYVGHNWQVAPAWVVGIEAHVGWARNRKTIGGIPGTYPGFFPFVGTGATLADSASIQAGWDFSLRGRTGLLVNPNWLAYVTAGPAWQQVKLAATCDATFDSWCFTPTRESVSKVKLGWTVGAGMESLLWDAWLARLEYRYADFGRVSHTFFASSAPPGEVDVIMQAPLKTHTVTVGIARSFAASR